MGLLLALETLGLVISVTVLDVSQAPSLCTLGNGRGAPTILFRAPDALVELPQQLPTPAHSAPLDAHPPPLRDPVPVSRLDDAVEFTVEASTDRLRDDRDGIARELIRRFFFAVNWPAVALSDESARQMVSHGYKYNRWQKGGPHS